MTRLTNIYPSLRAKHIFITGGATGIGAALVEVQTIKLPQGSAVVQSFSGAGVEWSLVQSQGDAAAMARGNRGGTVVDVRGVKGTIIEGKGNVAVDIVREEHRRSRMQ